MTCRVDDDRFRELRREAADDGDHYLVTACDRALRGDHVAALALAVAMADDDDAEPVPVTLPTGARHG